jgi:CheY-like chemotaxis protein
MDTHRRFSTSNLQRKASILVADDSTSTREILVSMLELEGYDVTGAVDGVDALKRLQGGKFNLIVSDLNMPRMDGLKLLENVRADPEHHELPVIIVTTVDEPETRKRAKALGASRYILKSSFAQDDLIAAVKELVDREGATREESVHAGESP